MHSWVEAGEPVRLLQKEPRKDDPEPKALSCYGLYLPELKETWLRFVDGRPVSAITTQFLRWCCRQARSGGQEGPAFDLGQRKLAQKPRGERLDRRPQPPGQSQRRGGVRIVACLLPTKSPWLNAIEPKWIHSKRKVTEPERLLGAYELADRVCGVFGCPHYEHLSIPQEVA